MEIAWGLTVTVLSLLCWGGQVISWLAPATASRFGLVEAESEVEPAFWADVRGEALWDSLTLWPMVVTGMLLIAGSPAWPYFGLVGGGMYLYLAGRGVSTRLTMRRRGLRIGGARSVRTALVALTVWGAMSAVTVAAAVVSVQGS